MKHFPADKYNLAWFKLAECVVRGEKERALGVYRLLSHSIEDRAYALKLEGDILSSFNDSLAQDRYRAALIAYKNQGRFREAIGMSEYLLTLDTRDLEILDHLLFLYQQTGLQQRCAYTSAQMVLVLVQNSQFQEAEKYGEEYSIPLQLPEAFSSLKSAIALYALMTHAPASLGHCLLRCALLGLLRRDDHRELQQFLAELETMNEEHYSWALEFLAGR